MEVRSKIDTEVNFALLFGFFNKLFVVHGHLLLVLLKTNVDAVNKHLAVGDSSLSLSLYLRVFWLLAFLAHRLHYLLVWCKVYKVEKACLRKHIVSIG